MEQMALVTKISLPKNQSAKKVISLLSHLFIELSNVKRQRNKIEVNDIS